MENQVYTYAVSFEPDRMDGKGYLATFPAIDVLAAHGATLKQTQLRATGQLASYVHQLHDGGERLPDDREDSRLNVLKDHITVELGRRGSIEWVSATMVAARDAYGNRVGMRLTRARPSAGA